MMRTINSVFFSFLVVSLVSCQKEKLEHPLVVPIQEEKQESLDAILGRAAVIGAARPNPYSEENMLRALREYNAETKSDVPESVMSPTHHYIVFKPSCHAHYRSLVMRSDIDTDPFPLDHEISDGWVMLDPDPEYSTNGYQHRWGYVPVDVDLSGLDCPYEILYDIVSPEEEETKSRVGEDVLEVVEALSYKLCGLPPPVPIVETKATSVTPHGNITYRDSSYNAYIGCHGMSVKAQRLTKKSYGHCDEAGNFVCDKSFKYNWTYTVFFSRTDFEMRRDSSTVEIMLVFSDRHDALNLQFKTSNQYVDHIFYCEILRAACRYFYLPIDGLNRPPMADELNDRLYIQAVRGADTVHHYYGVFYREDYLASYPFIRVYRDSYYLGRSPSDRVYHTTIHELAHSSHWKNNPSYYVNSVSSKVKESFATGIAWHLTKKVHSDYYRAYYGDYTGIVEDIIDNDGYKSGDNMVMEFVTGFTIKNIEDSVQGASSWDSWAQNLKTLFPYNPTISEVQSLFDIW